MSNTAQEQPVMIFLTGISFAGKSVLARALSETLGFAIVDPDQIGHDMGLGMNGEFLDDTQWETIHRVAERTAVGLLRSGQSIIYDTTAFTRDQRDRLRGLATSTSATPILVLVDTSRSEACNRWKRNNRLRERFVVHEDDFNMVADQFEPPSGDEQYLRIDPEDDIATWINDNRSTFS